MRRRAVEIRVQIPEALYDQARDIAWLTGTTLSDLFATAGETEVHARLEADAKLRDVLEKVLEYRRNRT